MVVASTGLIMTSVIGIILGSFKAQNRNASNKKITENGSYIINELRKNVFNSEGNEISCSEDKLSVGLKNMSNGGITTISCNQSTNKIASTSATKEDGLNTNEVTLNACTDFVVCEKDTHGSVSGVVFNFGLGAVTNGVGASQTFNTRVTLRN